MRQVHKYKGHTIVPDTKGWAVSWVTVTSPPIVEIKLGISKVETIHHAEFFKTLALAKQKCNELNTQMESEA